MTSFADLKRDRSSLHDKIIQETQKIQTGTQNGRDERFWQPDTDKAGNGYAVIRFLPAPDGEDLPWVRLYSHGFQGPGGWYIENSLTTLGEKDPLSELNSSLWNRGDEAGKEQVRKQKRRLNYISNIQVVSDPANPQNEGKVFLYKFGKRIFDKVNDAMNPEFQDEKAVNPFDFWEGANFKIKIRQVEGYRNYDKSEFDSVSPVADNDEAIEKVWKQQYSLQEFLDPKFFKSYSELKEKLNRVLGLSAAPVATATAAELSEAPVAPSVAEAAPAEKKEAAETETADLDFFKQLANED